MLIAGTPAGRWVASGSLFANYFASLFTRQASSLFLLPLWEKVARSAG
ncbi:hypothetical protein MNBD_ALPHA12-1919 [hydrothermal vent metagenome]|uniref:Uncharacterized protein n=1 Tax=hydrothermal vent metagenome TaxID=652676 RepID=A0A3B0TMZ4_9ZZZZ